MSCRETPYSSAMFTLARYNIPIEDSHVQEEYHALRRQIQKDGEESTQPTQEEYHAEIDRTILLVRHHPMPAHQRKSLLARLNEAKDSEAPDATTWHATRKLSQRLIAMTDPLYCQSRSDALMGDTKQISELMENLRDREVFFVREKLTPEEIAETKTKISDLRVAVVSARKAVAAAKSSVLRNLVKPITPEKSTLLECDALADEAESLRDTLREQRKTLYSGYDSRDSETLRALYAANRHITAARQLLNQVLTATPR